MGASVSACLLAAGHLVVGLESDKAQRASAKKRVARLLGKMHREGLLRTPAEAVLERFRNTADVDEFAQTQIVIESIAENGPKKKALLNAIEDTVGRHVPIGCNTSAIPISILQEEAKHPKRILGIHWAEPAHTTRFLEVICGKETSPTVARKVMALSRHWGKEPTFLRRDIRGFITNRCFYALLREAMYLVENGYATVADVDRSLRNDLGYWITFAGPFRFMDLTGIPAYATVAKDLFPELANTTEVPETLAKLARNGAKGVANASGFYPYTKAQAERWEKLFMEFSYGIRKLAQEYPEDIGDRPKRARKKS
jgi:3-hydroxybutyryl-CoA dehydrogenase